MRAFSADERKGIFFIFRAHKFRLLKINRIRRTISVMTVLNLLIRDLNFAAPGWERISLRIIAEILKSDIRLFVLLFIKKDNAFGLKGFVVRKRDAETSPAVSGFLINHANPVLFAASAGKGIGASHLRRRWCRFRCL